MSRKENMQILNQSIETINDSYWYVSIRPSEDAFINGFRPEVMFDQLTKLGDIISFKLVTDSIPCLDNYKPQVCYLGWELILNSNKNKSAISAVFSTLKGANISILPPKCLVSYYAAKLNNLSDKEKVLGEMLSEIGALNKMELQQALSYQKKNNGLIGDILIDQLSVRPETIESALKRQEKIKIEKKSKADVVSVDSENLDKLVSLMGELVVQTSTVSHMSLVHEDLYESIQNVTSTLRDVHKATSDMYMVPVSDVFESVRREISKEYNDKIKFDTVGETTEIEKTIIDKTHITLMHLVRNSVEHGFDSSVSNPNSGKAEKIITFKAYREAGEVVLEVIDNGHGLNPERLLHMAKKYGFVNTEQSLYEDEIFNLLFEPDFSTKNESKNDSSRGIGMNIVRRHVRSLRGNVVINSILGEGTKVTIRLPLSMAVLDSLHMHVAGESFILATNTIVGIINLNSKQVIEVHDKKHITFRNKSLPVIIMNEHLGIHPVRKVSSDSNKHVVVVQFEDKKVGLLVDELHGDIQAVVKSLGRTYSKESDFSGHAIVGNGRLALILDIPNIVNSIFKDTFNGSERNKRKLYS